MAMTVHVDIVTSEGQIFAGLAEMISVTGELGDLGILPGHAALLTNIKPGQVRLVLQGGKKEMFYISGGMLEVQPSNVTILADTLVRAENIDEAAAIQARERAKKLLTERKSDHDYSKTLRELAQAIAQIRVIKELKRHRK